MKTNVYVASYEDLSQLSVNAETLKEAITSLEQTKNAEPMLIQRKITGIEIPDPPAPLPVAVIYCHAVREEEGETLPDTVTVRPIYAIERTPGSTVMVYAIDTAENPTVEFAGWYDTAGIRLSTEENFAFVVPEVQTSGQTIELIAKFRTKVPPVEHTVTLVTEMSDGVSPVPESCTVRPLNPKNVSEGDSLTLYAIVTDPAYEFIAWKNESGDVLSNDAAFVYTPTDDVTITAVFGEV